MKKIEATGGYIYTNSGNKIDFQDPDPAAFNLHDIAWSLSMTCRYVGHCDRFYSVAEHCILGAEIMKVSHTRTKEEAFAFLIHDAVEAYIGDLSAPLKYLCPAYKDIEESLDDIIHSLCGVSKKEHHKIVKKMDISLCKLEKTQLNPKSGSYGDYLATAETLPIEIRNLNFTQKDTYARYIELFTELRSDGCKLELGPIPESVLSRSLES